MTHFLKKQDYENNLILSTAERLNSGTFADVYKVKGKDGIYYAIKKIRSTHL
jgi:hypothetical protein